MIKKLLIVYLFTVSSVMAGLPPTTIKNQNAASKTVNFNLELPNNQSVPTAASTALITTGNKDELQNSNFEHSIATTGWTVSNATPSGNTANPLEGKRSLSLALTGALSLSQSSTINAAQKSGVQMVASIWVNSSDVSDLQLCSLKNGAEDKCTVTGGYVQGSGWRQLTVSFIGNSTSNGLKLKSTDTTGTVLVDQAYVGIGSPIVDFTPDMVYSAKISSTGVVSDENTDFIQGDCTLSGTANNRKTCTFKTSVFTVSPNCVVVANSPTCEGGGCGEYQTPVSVSASQIILAGLKNSDVAYSASSLQLICQKQGADYKTSKAYVASSSDTDWASCGHTTSDFTGFGTVSAINLQCKRKGGDLKIKGSFISGSPTSSEARINLKFNGSTLTASSAITGTQIAGYASRNVANNGASIYTNLIVANNGYITLSFANNAIANPLISQQGSTVIVSGDAYVISNELSIPIQGWTDSGVIVGSFEGIEKCANDYECTDTFSAAISSTGVVSNENINWINGNCTIPTGTQRSCSFITGLKDGVNGLTNAMNCVASARTGTAYTSSAFVSVTSSGFIFNSGYGTAGEAQDIIVTCQKGTNDYKPKTAKIASSIGVPTVPGVTTEAIDTFSVSYGTTNATTACSASPCSYLDQIGNAVISVTRSGTGSYSINTTKTYTKLKCNINSSSPSGTGVSAGVRCENCNSITFYSTNVNVAGVPFFDTYGTLHCQGSY